MQETNVTETSVDICAEIDADAERIFLSKSNNRRTYSPEEVFELIVISNRATYFESDKLQCGSGKLRSLRDFLVILRDNCNVKAAEAFEIIKRFIVNKPGFFFAFCCDIRRPTARYVIDTIYYESTWKPYKVRYQTMKNAERQCKYLKYLVNLLDIPTE